ncbi:MAG TPA: flavin reductase family protein [Gemmataceae bacterium]|nr:flavin reductase family protein [Gemmataceae bacterium]
MFIDVARANILEVYRTLVEVVTPRPIAWVTSVDIAGRVNLAPFSFYNAFGANPPAVVFSPVLRRDGSKKDTLRNVEATGEFVLNAAVEALAEQINLSSKELPYGESEVTYAGLTLLPSVKVKPPRVAQSPVHLECKLIQIVTVGQGPLAGNLVIGEILAIHIEERVLDERGHVDPRKLRTIARLGGDYYARTSDLFEMKRPQ